MFAFDTNILTGILMVLNPHVPIHHLGVYLKKDV